MILDEISLHDFGVYEGLHTLALTPPSVKRPIVLFTGLNGAGKTTILEALQVGLFGANAMCLAEQSYQEYMTRSINKKSRWGQSGIGISFRRMEDGQEVCYRLSRVWKKSGEKIKESLEIYRNDQLDRVATENWAQLVDEIIPASISNFFFFDGEKIESYANPESARELICDGIHNLLGLDVVNRLGHDLKILFRRRQSEKLPPSDKSALAEKEAALKILREEIQHLMESKAELRTRKIDMTERRLKKVEKEYKKMGGDLFENRDKTEKELSKVGHDLQELEKNMQGTSSGRLPLALVKDLLVDLEKHIVQADEFRDSKSVITALKKRDAEMLEYVRGVSTSNKAIKAIEDFCASDLANRAKHIKNLRCTYRDDGELSSINPKGVLEQIVDLQAKAEAEAIFYGTFSDRAEDLKNMIAATPSSDSIASLLKEREQLRAELAKHQTEFHLLSQEINNKQANEAQLSQTVESLWKKVAEAELAKGDAEKFLGRVHEARETLEGFRDAMLAKNIHRMESLVLDCYQLLLRKESLIGKLVIHPDNFRLSMTGKNGEPLEAEQLSAGERQLLAVALLWGLGKASARPLPIAIDTPLGRLDSAHRTRLIDHYFSQASHQVLLFSTDEEISGDYLERLQPWIGKKYHLNYSDSSGSTTISEVLQ